jgi:hypothetical protein
MFSLLIVICVSLGYYYFNKMYPRDTSEQLYFGIFITTWIFMIYLLNFQEAFIYKLFKGIYAIQQKPLYDLSDFSITEDTTNPFNLMLLQNQGSRCGQCNNFILPSDIKYTSLNFKIPLHQGGSHDHSNLTVVCPNCNTPFYE